jgi:hypothetical protein
VMALEGAPWIPAGQSGCDAHGSVHPGACCDQRVRWIETGRAFGIEPVRPQADLRGGCLKSAAQSWRARSSLSRVWTPFRPPDFWRLRGSRPAQIAAATAWGHESF